MTETTPTPNKVYFHVIPDEAKVLDVKLTELTDRIKKLEDSMALNTQNLLIEILQKRNKQLEDENADLRSKNMMYLNQLGSKGYGIIYSGPITTSTPS